MNEINPGDKIAFIEVPEGDHCLPCVYMAEVVQEAVKKCGQRVRGFRRYPRGGTG
jgi:hypothetical protein